MSFILLMIFMYSNGTDKMFEVLCLVIELGYVASSVTNFEH